MLNTILIDSGPLIALFDKNDSFHARVVRFIQGKKFRFLSTTAVLTEVTHMLDFNINAQLDFLEWVLNEGVIIQDIKQEHISRIIELTKKYCDRANIPAYAKSSASTPISTSTACPAK